MLVVYFKKITLPSIKNIQWQKIAAQCYCSLAEIQWIVYRDRKMQKHILCLVFFLDTAGNGFLYFHSSMSQFDEYRFQKQLHKIRERFFCYVKENSIPVHCHNITWKLHQCLKMNCWRFLYGCIMNTKQTSNVGLITKHLKAR